MSLTRRRLLSLVPLVAGLPAAAPAGGAGREGGAPALDPEGFERKRAREFGVRIGRLTPGPFNAITDVPGVRVGHTTLVRGEGPLVVGEGPVRTGVTAILPCDDPFRTYLPCGVNAPNGNGELTGLAQAAQLGVVGSPICFTNSGSVGRVYDALVEMAPAWDGPALAPVVGETWDADLNDIEGRHVGRDEVRAAVGAAASGPVPEGAVGGGTGMTCYGFKGGIGTASRRVAAGNAKYFVGALVQANHGSREMLRIDGVPVGEEIPDLLPELRESPVANDSGEAGHSLGTTGNSILMLLATDAPLLAHQLARLARRAVHGLAKTGSISSNSSGDFALAFSTANPIPRERFWSGDGYRLASVEQFDLQPLLEAAAEAVEEAIVNALFMAETMVGRDGNRVWALPIERTLASIGRHGRQFAPALRDRFRNYPRRNPGGMPE